MKFSLSILALSSALLIGSIGGGITEAISRNLEGAISANAIKRVSAGPAEASGTVRGAAVVRYQINAAQSRFMANVGSGGPLWFLGHTHHFAIRDFKGEASISPGSLAPASLEMTVKAASLEETGKNFTDQQKQMINNTARKQVLQVDEYPEIVFKSTTITGVMKSDGQYEAKIGGDLTLHGVTRPITIPAQVSVNGNSLHANGEFSVDRNDYKVKTHSIKWGMIRVRNKINFEFDIVANKV